MRFVGRQAELAALADVAAAARNGPAVAVVVGGPGSGKSRLLEEARARSALTHSFAIVGFEAGEELPLTAASGLLRALTDVPVDGPRLEELVFGAGHAGPFEPVRVFEAAHRCLAHCQPALLLIDDLQWVDELSYALAHFLLRAAVESRQRLVVYAARRRGGRGGEFTDSLIGAPVDVLELAPLDREHGIDLACELNADLDRDAAATLWERAEGSPFWIGALANEQSSFEELITSRLRGAGPDPADLLGLLAVAGRSLSVVEIGALLEWPAGRVTSALERLADRGLAVSFGASARPSHDLVREAAVAELEVESLQRLHQALADRFERVAADDVALLREALEHRRAAGLPSVELAARIARSPRRRLIGSRGIELLAEIADEADPFDPQALGLRESVAVVAGELGDNARALDQWTIVAERVESRRRSAEALLSASRAAYALEHRGEARALLDRSREINGSDDVLELEQETHDAAIRLWLELDTERGRAAADTVVMRADLLAESQGGIRALDDRARRAYLDARRLESDAALQAGDSARLLRAGEARRDAARGFDVEQFLAGSLNVGTALHWSGRIPEAVDSFSRVWEEAQRLILPAIALDASYFLAGDLHVLGRLVDAERVVQEATELIGRVGDVPRGRHRVARVARLVELERVRAREALNRLALDVEGETNEHQRIDIHGDAALWHARLDGPAALDVVRTHVAAGRACADSVRCPRCEAELLLLSAEALARGGAREEALRLLDEWRPSGGSAALNEISLRHGRALAEARPNTRATALEDVLRAAAASPYAIPALWIRLDLGVALAEDGDRRATATLQEAAELAGSYGAGTVESLAQEALRALGIRTWRRGAAGAPLTDRELEISELVAGGATNREIARMLFLAPKTVERHVSNALRKVGARNRTELAVLLREQGRRRAGNAR